MLNDLVSGHSHFRLQEHIWLQRLKVSVPPPVLDHRRQSESWFRSFIFPVPMFVDYILTAKGGIDPALLSSSPPPRYIREKRSQLTPWLWIWKCILLMLKWHCNFCSDFLQQSYSTADKHVWAQIDSQWLHGGLSSLAPCVWLQMEIALKKKSY